MTACRVSLPKVFRSRCLPMAWRVAAGLGALGLLSGAWGAGTDYGEIQARPAPVYRCPGLPCVQPNVFNISVAVHFDATAGQLADIRDLISDASAGLFDVTDGQAQIGEAFVYNNAFGTDADVRIYPSSSPTWWYANTGSWALGGSAHVSYNYISSDANPGPKLAHELTHLIFDARDEYESRAVGCGDVLGSAHCPAAAAQTAGEESCLMDHNGTELCWGHGDPADLTDISGGNHDATLVTEQSRCRSDRSCWEQVVWSWPDHFTMPAGAPDPDAGGAVVDPTSFVLADATVRVVLVLDESGSMSSESPTRMERLQVAAMDFVGLAENGTELGIVSFSDDAEPASGHANVAVAPLGAVHRAACMAAINALTPGEWTNIGDGLQKARAKIMAAGGVTASTYIILMTDGLNNRPEDDPAGHLNDALADLLADGIPVYVTCTGGDLGLSSQCSEIAAATGGFYVDSADAADLPQSFADFHEKVSGREAIDSAIGVLGQTSTKMVYVEEGSESATFVLLWDDAKASATLTIKDPAGNTYEAASLPQGQGRYFRRLKPIAGNWQMTVTPRQTSTSRFIARAYIRNQIQSLTAAVRRPRVLPGREIVVYAYPRSIGGAITHPKETILGTVLRPDGQQDEIKLYDDGQNGDDLMEDGIFTGVYRDTKIKGPYRFHLRAAINKWLESTDRSKHEPNPPSPQFTREVRLSAAVAEPQDTKVLAIVDVTGCTLKGAHVTFSVPVTPATAGVPGNYSIEGLEVVSAKVLSPTRVRLETSLQRAKTQYTLVAQKIRDTRGNSIGEPGNAYTFTSSEECVTLEFTRIVSRSGAVTVEWTGGGTLQIAPSAFGPWQDVPRASTPLKFEPTARQQYMRLRK